MYIALELQLCGFPGSPPPLRRFIFRLLKSYRLDKVNQERLRRRQRPHGTSQRVLGAVLSLCKRTSSEFSLEGFDIIYEKRQRATDR